MDTCTNCGETLRPGAKFCTTCGTRLNDKPTENAGWGEAKPESNNDSDKTTLLEAVPPPPETDNTWGASATRHNMADSWTSAYGSDATTKAAASSDDPASRFISALDDEVKSVPDDEQEADSEPDAESTWDTPAFTPPPPSNWSFRSEGDPESESKPEASAAGDDEIDSSWKTPSTWAAVQTESASDEEASESVDEPDSAGFTEGGDDEVDYLSGDENIERAEDVAVELPPDEARDKAIALADELRRTIRMMSSSEESDHGAAIMALTEASLHVGDFSDVRGVVADVKNNPRDIQSLSALAGKIDRIEALLDEQKSLVEAIELAVKELNG